MKGVFNTGFTLVELLIVIAMIAVLMGAVSSSVAKAQTRAKVSRATVDCREITNAILAYENYDKDHSLDEFLREDQDAKRDNLKFILGEGGNAANNKKIPTLYNGALQHETLADPWGRPYKVTIRRATGLSGADQIDSTAKTMEMSVFVPNYNRLSDGERSQ